MHVLGGHKFTIPIDQDAIKWIPNFADAIGKLNCWRLRLPELEIYVVHRVDKKNQDADTLSRVKTEVQIAVN